MALLYSPLRGYTCRYIVSVLNLRHSYSFKWTQHFAGREETAISAYQVLLPGVWRWSQWIGTLPLLVQSPEPRLTGQVTQPAARLNVPVPCPAHFSALCCSMNPHRESREGWRDTFGSEERLLLEQGTMVQFPVPTWQLTAIYDSSSRGSETSSDV